MISSTQLEITNNILQLLLDADWNTHKKELNKTDLLMLLKEVVYTCMFKGRDGALDEHMVGQVLYTIFNEVEGVDGLPKYVTDLVHSYSPEGGE